MNLVRYIRDLLCESDCVILPGLGGFVGNYKSAEIHPITHIFTPPAKSLAFNARLITNDGLLVDHIAKSEELSLSEVQSKLEAFIASIQKEIQESSFYILEGIGKLFLNANKSIQFEPEMERFPIAEAFGCQEFFIKPIEREESIKLRNKSTDLMSSPERPKRPVKRVPGKPAMRKKVPVEKRKVEKKSGEKKEKSGGGKAWIWISLVLVLLLGGAGAFFVQTQNNVSLSSLAFWKKNSQDVEVVDVEDENGDAISDTEDDWESSEASASAMDSDDSEESTDESSSEDSEDASTDSDSDSSEEAMADAEEDMESSDESETEAAESSEEESTEDEEAMEEDTMDEDESDMEEEEYTEEPGFFDGLIAKVKGWFGMGADEEDYSEDESIAQDNGWEESDNSDSEESNEGSSNEEEETNSSDESASEDEETASEPESTPEPVVQPSVNSSGDVVVSTRTDRHYVIAGAFENPENARKYRATLAEKGYDSKILEPRGVKNVHRVTIADFSNLGDAMGKVNQENPEFGNALWVLRY